MQAQADQTPAKPKKPKPELMEEQKERQRQYARARYHQKKLDPEWMAKFRERNRHNNRERRVRCKQDPELWAKITEQNRRRSREQYQRSKQNPEWVAKQRKRSRCPSVYARNREAYARLMQNPEFRAKERERSRPRASAWRERIRLDPVAMERRRECERERQQRLRENPEAIEQWRISVQKRVEEWRNRPEVIERYRKRQAIHKARMENDPHYAYYHREYLKERERERKGQTEIDPNDSSQSAEKYRTSRRLRRCYADSPHHPAVSKLSHTSRTQRFLQTSTNLRHSFVQKLEPFINGVTLPKSTDGGREMETKQTTKKRGLSFWDAVRKASEGLSDYTVVQVRYPGLHGDWHVDAVATPRIQVIACEHHHLPIEFLYHRKWEIVKPEDNVLIETNVVTFEEAFAALLVGKIVGQRNRTETYRLRGNYKVVDPMQAGRTMSFVFRQEEINATDWIIYGDW